MSLRVEGAYRAGLGIALSVFLFSCGAQINTLSKSAKTLGAEGVPASLSSFLIQDTSPTRNTPLTLNWGIEVGSHSQYCILENNTQPAFCIWRSGALPTSYNDSAADGPLVLSVFLKNTYGTSARIDSNSVVIDRTPPTLASATITNSNPTSSATFSMSYGAITGTYSQYCIQENNTAVASCTWVTGALPASKLITGGDGSKVLTTWLRDAAGNVSNPVNTAAVVLDTGIPTVTIVAPVAGSSITPANVGSFSVNGACSELGRNVVISGSASATVSCVGGAWSTTLDFSAASDGTVTINVNHSDTAGNAATQASRSFTKDTTLPTVAITSPVAGSYVNNSNKTAFAVSGTCSENGRNVVLSGDASKTIACAAGTWSTTVDFSGVADGTVTLNADHSDASGNNAAQASRTFTKDTGTPIVAITLPAAGSYVNNANKAAFAVSGTCTENGQNVVLSGDTSKTVACAAGAWSTTVDFSAASDGTVTLNANHSDAAGNAATQNSRTFNKDAAVPSAPSALALDTPASSPGTSSTPIIQVSGVTSGDTIGLYSDNSCTTSKGSGTASGTTINITSSALTAGAYTFYAKATDAAGNASACSTANVAYTYTVVNQATGLAWLENSPAPSNVINAGWTLSTSAIANQKIQFYSDATCTTTSGALIDLSSATQQNYSFTGTPGGTYSFIVKTIDASALSMDSACSGGITISSLRISPQYFEYPVGAALSQTFVGSGGSGSGYSYAALSGPGSINGGTGVYTSAVGNRVPGDTTQIQVTDSASATALATIKHRRFTVDGMVNAAVTDGTSLYFAGGFNWVNPDPATGFVAVDTTTGASVSRTLASSFNGSIIAILIQGNTAYVGGSFTSYQGTGVNNLAKIDLVTGQLDTTFSTGGAGSTVSSLALSGNSLYVGGSFTSYRGDTRGYMLAKVNAKTGALDTAFNSVANSGPNSTVSELAISGNSLYVAGSFTTYRGNAKGYRLAKVDATTGALDTTNFNTVANSGPDNSVNALVLSGSSLYIGGSFTSYRGDTKGYYLAKVDATTGALDTVNFNTVANSGPSSFVDSLALSGTSLYLGGNFTSYRGDPKGYRLAKVDATTGALDTVNFNTVANAGPNSGVNAIAVSGGSLYLAGLFTAYRGDTKGYYLAKISATTGVMDTANFNTTANAGPSSTVTTLALSGSTLYVGGQFRSYRGGTPAQNLAKIDIATGAVDTTFTQPTGPNGMVNSLLLSGTSLYVGGGFTDYRGDSKGYKLAKVDTTTGAMDTVNFNTAVVSGPNNSVYAMVLSGSYIYIGGNFSAYRGNSKGNYIAKIDATTGALETTNFNTVAGSGPNNTVRALALSGASLFIGGDFTSYRGDSKGYYLVKVDATTGVMDTANFNTVASTGPNSNVYALVVSGASLYLGGAFTTYRGDAKGAYLAKVDATTGVMDTANFNTVAGPNSSVSALVISGASLYAGGGYLSYRGDSKGRYLAKIDTTTGAMDTANFNTVANAGPDSNVYMLTLDGSSLYVGGQIRRYRGSLSGAIFAVDTSTGIEE